MAIITPAWICLEESELKIIGELATKYDVIVLEDLKQKEADGNVQKKDARKQAFFYRDEIVPAMEALRAPVDALEMKVDRSFWPMPGYADLLFEV